MNMSNINMKRRKNILEVLGCYSPNIRMKPVSMYKIITSNEIIYLDMGYGNVDKVDIENLNKTKIFISHNHIDHAFGLIELYLKLKIKGIILKNKIDVYMPSNCLKFNLSKTIINKNKFFNIHFINKNSVIRLNEYEITFCNTIHIGESYAIKFSNVYTNKFFVYTSDVARISKKLIKFSKGANLILIEGGKPVDTKFSLKNYHANTKDIIENILKAKPKKIILTHLKVYAEKEKSYDKYCDTVVGVELVRINKFYNIV